MRPFSVLLLFCATIVPLISADENKPLSPLAEKILADGKDASLNAFFSGQLGLPATKPIPLKRLTVESADRTNVANVSLADKQALIFSVREKNLTTFYLTDSSGKLRKASVNDSSVRDGGLTNLPLARAEKEFSSQKQFWLSRYPAKRSGSKP